MPSSAVCPWLRVGTRFRSVRDVLIRFHQFINGWSEPVSPPCLRKKLADQVLDKINAIGFANTLLACWGLRGREVCYRRSRGQPTPEDSEGEHHREHRIAQGGGLQDQPRQGNHQCEQRAGRRGADPRTRRVVPRTVDPTMVNRSPGTVTIQPSWNSTL